MSREKQNTNTGKERLARIEGCLGAAQANQLRAKRIAVVGVGALGGPVVQHLSMLGIDKLWLIDNGMVEPANLGNQGFDAAHVGLPKVEARREQIKRIHPDCDVHVYETRLESLAWGVLAGVDLVICGLDSLAGRILLNEICSRLGLPWIDGATDGSGRRMFGRVASFGSGPDAPCFICSFDQRQLAESLAAERRGCRSWWDDPSPPTLSASPECAVIAGLQCVAAIKRLTGTIDPAFSTELLVDLDTMQMQNVTLQRNPRCLNPHAPFGALERLNCSESIGFTLASLKNGNGGEPCIKLYRKTFISRVRCMACGREVSVGMLDSSFHPENAGCSCGALLTPSPYAQHDSITEADAEEFMSRTWQDIGLTAGEVVTGHAGGKETHFIAVGQSGTGETYHE